MKECVGRAVRYGLTVVEVRTKCEEEPVARWRRLAASSLVDVAVVVEVEVDAILLVVVDVEMKVKLRYRL